MHKIIILLLLACNWILSAFIIPYTAQEVKSDQNSYSKFYGIDTDDSLKCPLETKVWLWHDGENLLVLWEAEIDSSFSEGKFASRDNFISGDNLRFQVITDVNKYYSYVYYAYTTGVRTDGIRATDLNISGDWNSKYTYKNEFSKKLWRCQMTIPFKDLRFKGEPPYRWKIVLTRYNDNSEKTYSAPFIRTTWGKDYFKKAADIVINEKIADNSNMLLRPYYVKKYDMMNKSESFDPDNIGLDFAYNPDFSTKIKVSLNPDFSDVPLDAEQSTFNQKYAPVYGENRYFFTEDLDAFGVDNFLFYTRKIAKPKYALKVTGNTPGCSYGFLSTLSKETDNYNKLLETDVYDNVLAYKPVIDDLTMQFTLISRSRQNYRSDVFHFSPSYTINRDHSVWGDVNLSYKDGSGLETQKGYNYSGGYSGKYNDLGWSANGGIVSEDFTADIGRDEERGFYFENRNLWWNTNPYNEYAKSYGWNYWGSSSYYNEDNQLRFSNNGGNIWINTAIDINGNIGGNLNQEYFDGIVYNLYNANTNISFEFWKEFQWNIGGETGTSVIYDYYDKYRYNNLWGSIWGEVSKHLSYNVSANLNSYVDFPKDGDLDDEFIIANAGTTVNFTNDLSITNGLRFRNDHSYQQQSRIGFFTNFRWEFKPDCHVFIGYSTAGLEEDKNYTRSYELSYCKVNYSF